MDLTDSERRDSQTDSQRGSQNEHILNDANIMDDDYVEISKEDIEENELYQSENQSSDIDIIEESDDNDMDVNDDMDDETASLCSSSVMSQMSTLSFLRDRYLLQSHLLSPDYLNEDLSESSSLNYRELSTEVELKRGVRAYVHTPNTGLNVKLNLVLVLSVTAVIGLGIGNFIGWSKHWNHHRQLSMGQVMKLKQLQDELVVCMQNQDTNNWSETQQNTKICYSNTGYWKEKFEKLFSENRGLHELLEKTQKHYHLKGNHDNILSDKECDNKSANDEFHKLKLDLLVNQMEHLQLLKVLEEVKFKEKLSEKRAQVLEIENSELKMKLVEEEADDQLIVESWGTKYAILEDENKKLRSRLEDDEEEDLFVLQEYKDRIIELQTENDELKAALKQLEAQVVMVGSNSHIVETNENHPTKQTKSDSSSPIKLDLLRQRINQMVIENEELKSTIARIRWSSQLQENDLILEDEEEKTDNDVSALEEQLVYLHDMLLAEQTEVKKWKEMYEEMKNKQENQNNKENIRLDLEENIFSDWIWNLTNFLRDGLISSSSLIGDRLKSIYDQILRSDILIADEIFSGINSTQIVLTDLNQRIQNKWEELQLLKNFVYNGNEKLTNKMAKLLENTLQKLQEAGEKLINKEKTIEARIKSFSDRISRLLENLDDKWNDLVDKWTKRYARHQNLDVNEKTNANINWIFQRADARREQQNKNSAKEKETNWMFRRAKDREILRVSDNEDDSDEDEENDNWYLKREKKLRSYDENDSDEGFKQKYINKDKQFTNKESFSSRER